MATLVVDHPIPIGRDRLTSYSALSMPLYREVLDAHKGRCAIASSAIRAGACVLSTSAVSAVSSCCGWCFTPSSSLSRCTGCRRARYCSRSCQQRDWSQHRRECAAWKTIPKDVTSPTVLLVARLSAKLYLDHDNVLQKVTQLRHHLDDHRDTKWKQFQDMAQLVLLLLSRWKTVDRADITESFDELQRLEPEILKLFGRVNCNAFSVANDVTNEAVGIGLFPDGALFNHDCDPNCVVSFRGQQMQVHTVREVKAGDELTVSYIELLQPTASRRRELKDSYFFDCDCERCQAGLGKESREDWYLDGLVCKNKECTEGVVVVEASVDSSEDSLAACKMCGATRDPEEIRKYEQELAAIAALGTEPEESRWEKYQREWEIVRDRLQLHPRSTRVAVLAREIGNCLLGAKSVELQRKALPFCFAELNAVQWLLPQTKLPSRGLLHFQIGKLLYEQENTARDQVEQIQRATKHLQEALAVLDCAYGNGSTAVQSAQLLLNDVECGARQFL